MLVWQGLNLQIPDLYGKSENDEGDIRFEEDPFPDSFGWVFNCIKVADVKGIILDEAWDMTGLEALNIFSKVLNEKVPDLSLKSV